ncbi:hypothetical protein Ahy_B06g082596 [Arachis hypogaea]|uniref:PB1-like domain-containing protein n=1 Tax=Arachis hypogaea TaxID=3818 RepID=A0A444YNL9_ARAHY|nr:hypothetical protein Ahy_B06g082596 [Arachis hypogaea]
MTVYHWGRFGYDNGTLQYIGGQKTLIEDVESDCWSVFEAYAELRQFGYTKSNISALWYKNPTSEWLEKALKLFAIDRDALEMCRIAELRSHVEMFVVYEVEDAEGFPEVGYVDVGDRIEKYHRNQLVPTDNVQQVSEGDDVHPNVAAKNAQNESNIDDDSDDEEFLSSDLEVDSANDVHFTDSEEEYDDESGFEELTGVKDGSRVDKGKGVVNIGGGSNNKDRQEEDDYEKRRYPIHKDVKDMGSYKWEVENVFASRVELKDNVIATVQTRRGISSDLWEKTEFDDVMPPPYRKPSHRIVKKRKRGPEKAEDRSQSHLSRRE